MMESPSETTTSLWETVVSLLLILLFTNFFSRKKINWKVSTCCLGFLPSHLICSCCFVSMKEIKRPCSSLPCTSLTSLQNGREESHCRLNVLLLDCLFSSRLGHCFISTWKYLAALIWKCPNSYSTTTSPRSKNTPTSLGSSKRNNIILPLLKV